MLKGFVYLMASENRRAIYVGVTSDLTKRITEHKSYAVKGFTRKYNCVNLAYFEDCAEITLAIQREKQIKGGSRQNKIKLIERSNPEWKDLSRLVLGS